MQTQHVKMLLFFLFMKSLFLRAFEQEAVIDVNNLQSYLLDG